MTDLNKTGVISKYSGQNTLFPKRKETVRGGVEGQALKQVVGNWGNGRAAPKPAASLCRNQLPAASNTVCPSGQDEDWVFSPALLALIATLPLCVWWKPFPCHARKPVMWHVCTHPVTLPQMRQDAFQLWLEDFSPTLPQTGMLKTIVITKKKKKKGFDPASLFQM